MKTNGSFTIWVDADACPREQRDLLELVALRRRVPTRFVSNTYIRVYDSEFIELRQVASGADVADDYIVANAVAGDLVVTADIPLAARLIEKNVLVLNTRGEEMDAANIGERLAMRNLMEELRGAGMASGGPAEMTRTDMQRFADSLDRTVTKRLKAFPG